jgi:hypothetical protein
MEKDKPFSAIKDITKIVINKVKDMVQKYILATAIGLLAFFTSCEKEDLALELAEVPGVHKENTTIYTLNSKDNKGFSAGNLKLADFPKVKPDFIIIPQTNLTGDVMSPFLSHPNLEKRFILSKEFDDIKGAQAYFDSYNFIPQGVPLLQFANNIKPNQVWLVKTADGAFCKILILDTQVDKKSAFVEIKFKAEKMV